MDLSVDNEAMIQQQLSRVAVFELRDNVGRGDDDLSLDKVAEWLVEGPSASIGFCTIGDGMWPRSSLLGNASTTV